jgi:D-serine deaminase-like pyridoxal phosphate-dependent protein
VAGGERVLAAAPTWYVAPALVQMPAQSEVVCHETFAPILYTLTYETLDEAIACTTRVPQGLSSAIFTNDLREAEQFLPRRLRLRHRQRQHRHLGRRDRRRLRRREGDRRRPRVGLGCLEGLHAPATNTVNYSRELPLAQGVKFDAAGCAEAAAAHNRHGPTQLDAIEAWWRPDACNPFEVLLELGVAGGRTGVRSHDDALALARRAHASAAVRLAGIECYEGLGMTGDDAANVEKTNALMQRVQAAARQCDAEHLWDAADVILSAGGSSVFDLVVPGLRLELSRPVHGLLRSGCSITHDQGAYHRYVSAIERRVGCGTSLQAALEVWALVQSLPEPGLAILNAGRRDISFDMGLPLPIGWAPKGAGAVQAPGADWQITGLNDQHAHLRGDTSPLRVGDRIVLGLSHPCTTFDKWRWMPVVDEDYRVVDAITTVF